MPTLYGTYKNQPGPKPRKPIIVTNPNDSKLRAYNDSLTVYNAGEKAKLLYNKYAIPGKGLDMAQVEKWQNESNPKTVNTAFKRLNYPKAIKIENLKVYGGGDIPPAVVKHFQKPVQPVVYQKPQPNNKPTYQDSLRLYNMGYKGKLLPIPASDMKEINNDKSFRIKPIGQGPIVRHIKGDTIIDEIRYAYKKPIGSSPVEQPEKIFPTPVAGQSKPARITTPQQSMMPGVTIPVPKTTNWSFTYPGEGGVNKQQYFNSQTEYDAALKIAGSGNPIGNSNFMGSKQEGNQYSSQFRSQPKYQNGGSMNTLYAAYRKNKLAGGGYMNSSMDTEIPPIIGGGSRSYLPKMEGGVSDGASMGLGKQGTLGTTASRAGNKVNWGAAAGGVASLAGEIIDSSGKGDPLTGRKSIGSSVGKYAITGAALGTSIAPGWGTLIGAGVGAIGGLVIGGGERRKARRKMGAEIATNRADAINYSANMAASNPSLYEGYRNADYYGKYGGSMRGHYKYGGNMTKFGMGGTTEMSSPLATMYMNGGRAKSLSSDNAVLIGNSHKQGGIHIPEMNAEVEGGETTVGDYVFSKKLGFADLHKPIARAKGKIEAKPMTQERVNSLRRLKNEEQNMMMAQEYLKNKLKIA